MSNPYDVAARLAEGRPAVDEVEEYVAACRRLGYQHRDLTMHATQVRDWYGGEEGLDLRAVDADHAALSAAASGGEDAARMQADLLSELSGAWSGRGAAAAHQFVWRSGEAASAVSVSLSAAADAMATLRDGLWRAVDAKVLATEALEGRQQSQRAEWLAAAKTVTTGAGDLAAASELVELQVKPFVNLDVGSDWLAAMRAAIASINAAYDVAIAGTTTAPPAVFGVPGELGPSHQPSGDAEVADGRRVTVAPMQTVPAAAVGSAAAPAVPSLAPPPTAPWSGPSPATPPALAETAMLPPASATAMPPTPAAPSMPPLGDLGGGTSTLGSGLSGFGQQLADLIGGLVGSADDGSPDVANADGPADLVEQDDPNAEDDPDAEADPQADDGEDPDGPIDEPEEPGKEIVEEAPPESLPAPAPAPAPTPTPAPPPPAPQGIPESVDDTAEPTPCEIATDELPQVGE